ncbi:MAG: SDR family NAD(P)-dependent oxidoreductase [Clostridiales bacterium]|nr:SDR family NAD(P)-dependent oxidoreductase [Clostridiales bacterium]
MPCAVITGASSGLGQEYARYIAKTHPEIDQFYFIARRADRLEKLRDELGCKAVILPLDLTDEASYTAIAERFMQDQPDIRLLVCNAGCGRFGKFEDIDIAAQYGMVDLNCRALTATTQLALPYMHSGSAIIEVCSIAAFVPTPNMAVYCSTKAYVFSLAKALRHELKPRGVNVLAVCPCPMDTEFLDIAGINGKKSSFDILPRVSPKLIVRKSVERAFAGKAVYTGKLLYKFYRVLGKLLPHNWLMKITTV